MDKTRYSLKDYVEMFILLILSFSPFPYTIKLLIYAFLIITNLKLLKNIKVKNIYLLVIFTMSIAIMLDLRNVDNETPFALSNFVFLLPFVFGVIYIKKYSFSNFIIIFERVTFVVSLISIVGTMLIYFMPSIIHSFPTWMYYNRPVKSIIIYGAIYDYTGTNFLARNCGIAFEPGAFQLLPNLGISVLFSEYEDKNRIWIVKLITYIATILLTRSTAGLAIMSVLLLVNMVKDKKNFFIVITAVILLWGLLAQSLDIQSSKYETGNFQERFANSIYVAKEYQGYLFGLGATGYNKAYRINPQIGSWDTYTNLYIRYGYIFIVLFIYLNLKVIKLNKNYFIPIMLSLLSESLVGPLLVLFYYYAVNVDSNKDVLLKAPQNEDRGLVRGD